MNSNANHTSTRLPEILDHAAAEGLLASMHKHLQGADSLRVDASAVETLTYPCIQILLSAMKTHGGIAVENPSAAFVSAFEDLAITWRQDEALIEQSEHVEQGVENDMQQASGDSEMSDDACHPDQDQTSKSDMTKRILTIDDSKTIRDMLMLTLAEAGFDVLQAVDGQDGLDVLGNERVDVVITDINMPRMDGYEVIRQLRSKPDHKTTPILVLTTESELEKKNLAREVGATGWMVKPFDPERLIATVRKVAP
jgi:two-component system, chemotaxis family, chemotaxis protein CheY